MIRRRNGKVKRHGTRDVTTNTADAHSLVSEVIWVQEFRVRLAPPVLGSFRRSSRDSSPSHSDGSLSIATRTRYTCCPRYEASRKHRTQEFKYCKFSPSRWVGESDGGTPQTKNKNYTNVYFSNMILYQFC